LIDEKYQILILDDDVAVGNMLSEFLKACCSSDVIYCNNEDEFWSQIYQHDFDILFLDYQLPKSNGIEILNRLSAENFTLPTVMMTGCGSEMVAAKAIQSGAMDYLVKGNYDFAVLPTMVQKAAQLRNLKIAVKNSLEKIRYQAMLINNVLDAVVVWDAFGEITYWNLAAEELYEKKSEETLGKQVDEVYFSIFSPACELPTSFNLGKLQSERCFTNKKGEKVWISSQISPLTGGNTSERPVGFMDVIRDITLAKLEQEELVRSRHLVNQILEATPYVIYILNLDQQKLNYFTTRVSKDMGMNEEHLYKGSANLAARVHPEDLPRLIEHYEAARNLPADAITEFEYRVKLIEDPLGNWNWIKAREAVFSVDESGRPLEMIGAAENITQRKLNEIQIKHAQEHLAQASRLAAIGQLASSIAHQISNPLTTIIADSQILSKDLGDDEPAHESAKAILDAGWRAQQVIDELLKFSQPSKDSFEKISINGTIEKALVLVRPLITRAEVDLVVDLSILPIEIEGNTGQIKDLWVNLLLYILSQAQSSSGNTMQIQTENLENQAVVSIRNNWMNLPPEQVKTIFEPQIIPTSAAWGTGMELSICYEIVRHHKGEITLHSNPDITSFEVIFPKQGKL
jgi:PAS domain S-box-containing protein